MRENFLRNYENKEDLNHYIAKKMIEFHKDIELDLVVTFGDYILSSTGKYLTYKDIMLCTSEEADARLIRHALSCVKDGSERVVIRTVDTDVVVLLIGYVHLMEDAM